MGIQHIGLYTKRAIVYAKLLKLGRLYACSGNQHIVCHTRCTQALCGAPLRPIFTRRCERRAGAIGAPRRAGTAVRNGSDADVIYYLNRTNYLWSVLSDREPSSPSSVDLRTAQNSHAPARPVRRATPARVAYNTKPGCAAHTCARGRIYGIHRMYSMYGMYEVHSGEV